MNSRRSTRRAPRSTILRNTFELKDHYQEMINRLSTPKYIINEEDAEHEPKEKKKKELQLHPSIHNFHTIKWLRRKLGKDTIIRSIFTLIPNNGIPTNIDPEEKKSKMELLNELLSKYVNPPKKMSFTLDPHYMFTNETLNKIYMLRDIFLEFDIDGSRKLEMGELEEMFRTNNIITKLEDLCNLFFPENSNSKKVKEELNFYEFLEFALSANSDQSFRNFMRRLKDDNNKLRGSGNSGGLILKDKKGRHLRAIFALKEDKKDSESDIDSYKYKQILARQSSMMNRSARSINSFDDEPEEEGKFLPMNFNLVLDYFNKKGKVREWEKKIQKAVVSNKLF